MAFNLREHVREILATTPGEDLDQLVEAVLNETPVQHLREAYRQALAPVIRVALAHGQRPDPEDSRFDHFVIDTQNSDVEPGQTASGEEASVVSRPNGAPPPPAGPNLRNSRAAILRRNRYRISVWVGDGQYRSILDCTVVDLEHAAAESDRLSESNAAAARRYRKLVKAMVEQHAETVAELSNEKLEEVLESE